MKFLPVTKKAYYVHVSRPERGTGVYNVLEDSHYTTDEFQPFVLTGTRGEQWAVSQEKLTKAYQISEEEAARIGPYQKVLFTRDGDPVPCWAAIVPITEGPFEIRTPVGTVLHGNRAGVEHGWGDIIMAADDGGQPSAVDRWIVNGLVFFDTYQLSEV